MTSSSYPFDTFVLGSTSEDNNVYIQAKNGKILHLENERLVGNYYLIPPATTTITTIDTWTKVEGTTSPSVLNDAFDHTDNRLTYTGHGVHFKLKLFQIVMTSSLNGNPNDIVVLGISKNGLDPELSTQSTSTVDPGGRLVNLTSTSLISLVPNDYIEIHVRNNTGTGNFDFSNYSLTIS